MAYGGADAVQNVLQIPSDFSALFDLRPFPIAFRHEWRVRWHTFELYMQATVLVFRHASSSSRQNGNCCALKAVICCSKSFLRSGRAETVLRSLCGRD